MPIFDDAALRRQAETLPEPSLYDMATAPRQETEGTPKWPYLALAAGQGADALTTGLALQIPGAYETNPLGTKGVMIAKAGLTALVAYLMHRAAKKGDTKAMKAMGLGLGLAGAVPAAMNIRQLVKHQ